jgi:pyridoxine 5-phosphate synthase
MNHPLLLGVNIDHIATLRQARGTRYPDPVQAAILAEQAGADAITLHLREDRRHIQERDVRLIQQVQVTRMNLEMAVTENMLTFAEALRPENCCLVPERREELTTEGGLDVADQLDKIQAACQRLAAANVEVSLFIDPDPEQIAAAVAVNATTVEIHTGRFAGSTGQAQRDEYQRIIAAVTQAHQAGLQVNAGHGLNYQNVGAIAQIPSLRELNIGHAIIARALFLGLENAVREMRALIQAVR